MSVALQNARNQARCELVTKEFIAMKQLVAESKLDAKLLTRRQARKRVQRRLGERPRKVLTS